MDVNNYPVRVYESDQISKGYRKIVFKPGAPSASSEMNETQQIYQYNLNKLASSIYPDGTVISGGYIETVGNIVRIAKTTTNIGGNLFEIPATDIEITAQSTEIIGLLCQETYVTASDDPSLLNPAVGTANYGSTGADRIKIEVKWALAPNDPEAVDSNTKFYPVYNFVYGVLQTLSDDTSNDQAKLLNLLASYNYSSNGSYVTTGMEVIYTSDDEHEQKHIFELTAGEAFVEGYQINNKYNQKFYIDWLTDTKYVANETNSFKTAGWYPVRWTPINKVMEINGTGRFISAVTRTNSNTDRINPDHEDNEVAEIVGVSSFDPTGVENPIYDYADSGYSRDGDYINWRNSPNPPSYGSTYYITYDASVSVPIQVNENLDSIYVSGLNPGTTFFTDYYFYLKRIDRIILNRDGSISVLMGTPHPTNPMPPYSSSGLSLALVLVTRGRDPVVSIDTNKVYKMSDIRRLADKVDNNEYNISVLSLKDDIRSNFPMTNKTNLVVDPFANDNGRDTGLSQNAVTTGSSLVCGFNTDTLMVRSGAPILLDYTEVLDQQNDFATKIRSVNIYSEIDPNQLGVLEISPSKYSWVANETIRSTQGYLSNRTGFGTGTKGGETYGQNWRWMQEADYTTYNNTAVNEGVVLPLPSKVTLTVNAAMFAGNELCDLYLDVNASFFSSVTYEDQQFHITGSQKTINVTSFNIQDTSKFQLYIRKNQKASWVYQAPSTYTVSGNSVTIPALVSGDYVLARYLKNTGTHVGTNKQITIQDSLFATVQANADGRVVNAEIELPDFIKTGSRIITIRGRVTGSTAQTTFIADARSIDATVTYWYNSDPLAQTYMTTGNSFISSVDIFLEEYPTSYIDLLLAHTIVGLPDHEQAYNQRRKYKNELVLKQWNKFSFDTPSYVENNKLESFMVATSDSAAKVRCSELGHYDPYKGVWVGEQGYTAGTLLESSDAKTWSPLHAEDLTFRIYKAKFSSVKEVELGTVNVTEITGFILSTITQIYSGTSITYKAVLVDLPATSNNDKEFEVAAGSIYNITKYTGKIKISAILKSNNEDISPVLFGDVTMTTITNIWPSNYISRSFEVTKAGEAKIRVILDVYEPAGSTIKVSYKSGMSGTTPVYTDMTYTSSNLVAGDVYAMQYESEFIDIRDTQIQIIMDVTNKDTTDVPFCQNLRVFVEPKDGNVVLPE